MIARDICPISIVDDPGFLNLLKVAEPRYAVPCRSTVLRNLSDLYTEEKRRIRGIVASADYLCCTTDMWSSRTGDGYISLICHFITPEFKMCCHNLQTDHFPGVHDFNTICQALTMAAVEWCINLDKQIVAFTTDSGSNIRSQGFRPHECIMTCLCGPRFKSSSSKGFTNTRIIYTYC